MSAQPFDEAEIETLRKGATGAGTLVAISDRGFLDTFKEAGAMAKHLAAAKEKSDSPLIKQVAEGRGTGFGLTSSSAEVERERSTRFARPPSCCGARRRTSSTPTVPSCSSSRARSRRRRAAARRSRRPRSRRSRRAPRAGLIGVATGLRQTARPPAELYLAPWPAKTVEQLDRVIIRFAGDSGDGMQLTGDRFTSETACSATTSRPCPTSRRRSARRPARCPASRASSSTSPTTTSSRPATRRTCSSR